MLSAACVRKASCILLVFCLQKVLSSDSTSYVVEKIHKRSLSPLSQSFHSYIWDFYTASEASRTRLLPTFGHIFKLAWISFPKTIPRRNTGPILSYHPWLKWWILGFDTGDTGAKNDYRSLRGLQEYKTSDDHWRWQCIICYDAASNRLLENDSARHP